MELSASVAQLLTDALAVFVVASGHLLAQMQDFQVREDVN